MTGNAPFFISGEKSLVINGFDLNSLGIQRPAVIDRISIAVQTPVAGTPIDVVVYQDANGGSPVDATLAGSEQVTINSSGTFTAVLTTPITVTQPVVWIGFYLPVDFVFLADTSGTSVLTYWAWTSGGTFDLNTLSSAEVLGPADGTAPVNINMNGIARITAEITGANGSTSDNAVTPGGQTGANMSLIGVYSTCPDVGHDLEDEYISYGDRDQPRTAQIVPVSESPAPPVGYTHARQPLRHHRLQGSWRRRERRSSTASPTASALTLRTSTARSLAAPTACRASGTS